MLEVRLVDHPGGRRRSLGGLAVALSAVTAVVRARNVASRGCDAGEKSHREQTP